MAKIENENAVICKYFFDPPDAEHKWACKFEDCLVKKKTITQKPNSGWTNLTGHLRTSHPDFRAIYEKQAPHPEHKQQNGLENFGFFSLSAKASNIFGWHHPEYAT